MSEHILIFRGFARASSLCHVVVASDDRDRAVLLGELDDNPGTTVTNALESAAESVAQMLLGGDHDFSLYEYVPKGLPSLEPTFYRIEWNGQPGRFSMPTWHVVDPDTNPWTRYFRGFVRDRGYTSAALIAERKLDVVDARTPEDLPFAM